MKINILNILSFNSNINFVDVINCDTITINYSSPHSGFEIYFGERIIRKSYNFNYLDTIIDTLENIQNINLIWSFPQQNDGLTEYYINHFNFIKKITELYKIKLLSISMRSFLPCNFIEYILNDIYIKNILDIHICNCYPIHETSIENNKYLQEIIKMVKLLDIKIRKKIIMKNRGKDIILSL